jgi:hypothetical protein
MSEPFIPKEETWVSEIKMQLNGYRRRPNIKARQNRSMIALVSSSEAAGGSFIESWLIQHKQAPITVDLEITASSPAGRPI